MEIQHVLIHNQDLLLHRPAATTVSMSTPGNNDWDVSAEASYEFRSNQLKVLQKSTRHFTASDSESTKVVTTSWPSWCLFYISWWEAVKLYFVPVIILVTRKTSATLVNKPRDSIRSSQTSTWSMFVRSIGSDFHPLLSVFRSGSAS